MSNFVPTKDHLREIILHYFILKKSAADCHRLLVEAYDTHAPSVTTVERWFARFKSGDMDVHDKAKGRPPKKFEDAELQVLLNDDPTQTQQQLAEGLGVTQAIVSMRLKAMGKIQKEGRWVPHELNERQQENRKIKCEMLLQRHERKSFLHRIVTGDEKWIFFDNPKRKKSWVSPGEAVPSTSRHDRFGRKTMLCVWWDHRDVVYYELLKPGETVNGERYRQQLINLNHALIEKRPDWARRHGKVILLHDNAPSHTMKRVKDTLSALKWDVLSHPPYSPDLAPSDYHLFRSMAHGLANQHFATFEAVEKWVTDFFASKPEQFYRDGIHQLPERWQRCIDSNGTYFE